MTNKEWLDYLAHNAPDELADWFDAEHVEHQERALDGDTAALNARINELRAHEREWRVLSKQLMDEREQYRKLFGMALDWAHEITMLESSIDEGMA